MTTETIPPIDNRIVCIVDRESVILAAVISSYLVNLGRYFPLFLFPRVRACLESAVTSEHDAYVPKIVGSRTSVLINNALSRAGGYKYLVLAGLNEDQKSYIAIPNAEHTIEIADVSEVREKLSKIGVPMHEELACRSSEVLKGLFHAQHTARQLAIDESAPLIAPQGRKLDGIVVTEQTADNAACVVAVNYAVSIGANLQIVKPLEKREFRHIQNFVQKWITTGSYNQMQKVVDKINSRIGHINFTNFRFATFFTEGLPYAYGIDNAIPCSHVNLNLHPDLFVINNLLFERIAQFGSAVVFSLEEFFAEGESKWLANFLSRQNNFYVRSLVGEDATVANLEFNASHFPYDILHISSHGGEVAGLELVEEFTDRHGRKHVVEYDTVEGISHKPGDEMVEVFRKCIFRKFDGFRWMSPELEAQQFPQYVYEDMRKAICSVPKRSRCIRCEEKEVIASSCHILCSDSIHQGQFRSLASHSSPIVFNNACWSWHEVGAFFLASGARAYIGTLWRIRNDVAVRGARAFYENLFESTVLGALHKATQAIKTSKDRNIYMLWGLHFSTVSLPKSHAESRKNVFRELIKSMLSWIRHVKNTPVAEVRRNSVEILESIKSEILTNFGKDVEEAGPEVSALFKRSPKP